MMSPMHHSIAMAKYPGFLPIGKPKKLWDLPLWTNVRTGNQSTGPPLGQQGLAVARVT